ncbi:MAG: NADH:ubiquinone reductase (Na(+)-transporting) subunit C, partial [Flavobacteriaceae bacterium]|nr:NADH:ubiquinone reductase (Na(+)-transporting) subunit C [Flavobacteriaceae bacterium]
MNRNSNAYTFIFAIAMVVVVGTLLAFAATSLKPMQEENVRKEKMQNILSTVGVSVTRDEAEQLYTKYIKEELALKADGSIDASAKAFEVNMKSEVKKNPSEQVYPLYIAEVDNA